MLFITVLFSLVCRTTPINYCVPAGVGHQSAHILVIRIKITNKSEKKSAACQIILGNCSSKLVIGCQAMIGIMTPEEKARQKIDLMTTPWQS